MFIAAGCSIQPLGIRARSENRRTPEASARDAGLPATAREKCQNAPRIRPSPARLLLPTNDFDGRAETAVMLGQFDCNR